MQLERGEIGNGTVTSMKETVGFVKQACSLHICDNAENLDCKAFINSHRCCLSCAPKSPARMQDKREKQLRLVDVPGHPRISKGIFAGHTDRAKGVIFVVDSVDFMVQKDQVGTAAFHAGEVASGVSWCLEVDSHRHSCAACFDAPSEFSCLQVAEQLYDILASKAVSSRQMPVLLLANKADMGAKAHSVEFIRKRLEKALDQLRTTRADVEAESGNVSMVPCVKTPAPLL